MENIISIQNLTFRITQKNILLQNLSLDVFRGDRIGIYGKNGAGKSTLFNLIMGLEKPEAGEIEIFGKRRQTERDFVEVRRKIGLLFQNSDDQLFSPTVLEDIAFGPLNLRKSKSETIEITKECLRLVQLEGFEPRITHNLSGGEKKRVALASVLAMQPEVLLLDEPFAGLDKESRKCIRELLNNGQYSYLLIDHDIDVLQQMCQKIYEMKDGSLTEICK